VGAEGFEPYSGNSIHAVPLSIDADHQHFYAMRFDAIRTLSMRPLSTFCPLDHPRRASTEFMQMFEI
ncbi:hypothetical protein, partial [Rhodococcus qingshengii]|uniref:hypothetical protein n=1 Tax=Rhodococcus qingshengii TaxID=334542 RepID=UPI0036DB4A66